MTERDITVVKMPGDVRTFTTEDRTTSGETTTLKPGEPVKVAASGSDYVIRIADGDPEQSTDEFVGIVTKESTEGASTTSAVTEGEVEVITIIPSQTVLRGKATLYTDVETAAEVLDLTGDWVTFDVTSGKFTIDAAEGSDSSEHGLKIIGGDHVEYKVDVIVHAAVCEAMAMAGD